MMGNFIRRAPPPPPPEEPKRRGAPRGSNSLYDPAYANQAEKIVSRLGATDADLAYVFGVSEVTINAWKREHPEFGIALRSKILADAEVAHSLYRSATGFDHVTITEDKDKEGKTVERRIRSYVPPNVTAQIFWLKNRQPRLWRDIIRKPVDTFDPREQTREQMVAVLQGLADRGLLKLEDLPPGVPLIEDKR